MKTRIAGVRILLSICVALISLVNITAQKKVLFYGPAFETGNEAAELVANNPSEFYAIGSGSAVWTPGDPVASKDWLKKTTADFAAFDVIVIGDVESVQINTPTQWTGALANVNTWSAAITGNVLIFAGDPEVHGGPDGGGGKANVPGAKELIQQAIRFAAGDAQAGPGLYVCIAAVEPDAVSPVDPNRKAIQHLLSGLGNFTPMHGHFQQVQKITQHPFFANLTDNELSGWEYSTHGGFSAWPSGYFPIGLAIDAPPGQRTPSNLLPIGIKGLVHILAKSTANDFKQFYLKPAREGRVLGATHTVTATFLNQNGTPLTGKTVNFFLDDGVDTDHDPNTAEVPSINYPESGSGTTDANGTVSWSYTGGQDRGTDFIVATVTEAGATYEARAEVNWGFHVVTITATDQIAAEPATQGGVANAGTFVVTRNASLDSFTVSFSLGGTAEANDYDISPNTIFFDANLNDTTETITITPRFDTVSEVVETVVLRLEPDNPFNPLYVVGTPDEASINIASTTTDTVTITASDDLLDETGDNPGTIQVHRGGTIGDAVLSLEYSGTASFGDDYVLEFSSSDGSPTIESGQQDLFITVHPLPDTRSEGVSETVTITLKPSADGSYLVGNPSAETVDILDDDSVQIPEDGWLLTDLGTFGGYNGEGVAINTIPLGGGQFRGQVAGYQNNGTSGYLGALWDNGSYTLKNYPSGWYYAIRAWSRPLGLNDAGTVVGYCYYEDSYSNQNYPSYWNAGSSSPVLLPILSSLSGANQATAINQRDYLNDTGGIIVGHLRTPNGNTHAVMWQPEANETYLSSGRQLLGDVGNGDQNSFALAINHFGEVVGKSQYQASSVYHAFRSDYNPINNQPQTLGQEHDMGTGSSEESHPSEATHINNYGELVGASQFTGGNFYHAAYKSPDTPKYLGWYRLGVLGSGNNAGTQSIALGINNTGLIVGKSQIKVNNVMTWHGFVVSNQGTPGSQAMIDLNDMKDANTPWAAVNVGGVFVSAASQGWVIRTAEKVNDGNWIVGYGTKTGSGVRAFVLSPR